MIVVALIVFAQLSPHARGIALVAAVCLVFVGFALALTAAVLRRKEWKKRLVGALTKMLAEQRPRSAADAATWLTLRHLDLFDGKTGSALAVDSGPHTAYSGRQIAAQFTMRERLPRIIGAGLDTTYQGRPAHIVLRSSSGPGRGWEVDVELLDGL